MQRPIDNIWDVLDSDEFETVKDSEIVDSSRWSYLKEAVVKEVSTGKFFLAEWEEGVTEYQEVDGTVYLTEVHPYEKTVTCYATVV